MKKKIKYFILIYLFTFSNYLVAKQSSHENEIKWVLSIIFDYVLGIQCEIITSSIDEIILSLIKYPDT